MPKNKSYWDAVSGLNRIHKNPKNKVVIAQVVNGEYSGAGLDLKSNKGSIRLLGCRVNRRDRLLAITITHKERRILFFIEEVLNHAYEKSRFMDPAVLREFVRTHYDEIIKEIETESINIDDMEVEVSDIEPAKIIDFELYGNYIELSEDQEAALQMKTPAIIIGGPGTGKSCIALVNIAQYVLNNPEGDAKALCVTQEKRLIEKYKTLFNAYPAEYNKDRVLFLTYHELLEYLKLIDKNTQLATEKDFKEFFKAYKQTLNVKNNDAIKILKAITIEELYQEFRLASGGDEKDYLIVGENNTSFDNVEVRKLIWDAFNYYKNNFLKPRKLVDIAFLKIEASDLFEMIEVDEFQDLSCLQLSNLFGLAKQRRIAFRGDPSHQQLYGTIPQIHFLRQHILKSANIKCEVKVLSDSHRSPQAIVDAINRIIKIKYYFSGGKANKLEVTKLTCSKELDRIGNVAWLDHSKISPESQAKIDAFCNRTDFVIITLPELIVEAKKAFPNAQKIVSIQTMKGLEDKVVLAWRIFDNQVFRDANKCLDVEIKDNDGEVHRSKANAICEPRYVPHFNGAATTLSRGMDEVIILQDARGIENIKKQLHGKYTTEIKASAVAIESTQEEWLVEVKRWLKEDRPEIDVVAKNIYLRKLNGKEAEFNALVAKIRAPKVEEKKDQSKSSTDLSVNTSNPELNLFEKLLQLSAQTDSAIFENLTDELSNELIAKLYECNAPR